MDFRTPPAFVARLALEGYERSDALILLLEGEMKGTAPDCDIRPVKSEPDWDTYAALHAIGARII